MGVDDIRVIPSAQYNKALTKLKNINIEIINRFPILKYRVNNIKKDFGIRGMKQTDCGRCWLALDDMAVAGKWHFPCIIYLREDGNPIGIMSEKAREERYDWVMKHNSYDDTICRNNCLDVCINYNNKVEMFKCGIGE